jgi:UDP-glucose 4-epimerase
MMIERVLVTGGSGFLGSYVVRELVARGVSVAVLHRGDAWPVRLDGLQGKIHLIEGDLYNFAWGRVAQDFAPQAVIHMAWAGVAGDSRNHVGQADNISATLRLADLAQQWGVEHFIGAGSQAEYGVMRSVCHEGDATFPTTLYGHAKLATGQMLQTFCQQKDMRCAWLRIFSTYGAQDHDSWMIPTLIKHLLSGDCPPLTKGEQLWDFLHARDAASAFVAVLFHEVAQGVFNLGSGYAPPLAETIKIIRDAIDPDLTLGFGQVPYRPDQVMHLQADITRLKQLTNWSPIVSLQDGLKETVAWHAEQFRKN